jgi:hypothetical protein
MKRVLFILGFGIVIILAACSKSSDPAPDNAAATLKFTSLVVTDTLLKVNDVTTITASATGEELTYTWTADFGTFIGSGNTVQWTVCHADKFTINCKVTDKNNNSETKNVVVRTRD